MLKNDVQYYDRTHLDSEVLSINTAYLQQSNEDIIECDYLIANETKLSELHTLD